MTDMVKQAKTHWDKTFKQMEKDQKFAAGAQWHEDPKVSIYNDVVDDDLYVANITLPAHPEARRLGLRQEPAGGLPRRPRILSTVWDGTMES